MIFKYGKRFRFAPSFNKGPNSIFEISLLYLCKLSHCCTLKGARLNFALFKISFGPIILFSSPTLRYIPRHFVQISKHFLLFFNTNEVGIEFNAMKLFTMATNMSILYDTWIV